MAQRWHTRRGAPQTADYGAPADIASLAGRPPAPPSLPSQQRRRPRTTQGRTAARRSQCGVEGRAEISRAPLQTSALLPAHPRVGDRASGTERASEAPRLLAGRRDMTCHLVTGRRSCTGSRLEATPPRGGRRRPLQDELGGRTGPRPCGGRPRSPALWNMDGRNRPGRGEGGSAPSDRRSCFGSNGNGVLACSRPSIEGCYFYIVFIRQSSESIFPQGFV